MANKFNLTRISLRDPALITVVDDNFRKIEETALDANDLKNHIDDTISDEIGQHGMRWYNDTLQRHNGVDWEDIATGGGGLISATYAELKVLVDTNALVPGQLYLLTDYVTKYRQPYSNRIAVADVDQFGTNHAGGPSTGTVERLVLTAMSGNRFNFQCISLDWVEDIIYYDFNNNLCEDGETPRNGFIQRRIQMTDSVDMPYDWRTMLWARFKATAPIWTSGAVTRMSYYQVGSMIKLAIRAGTPVNSADINYLIDIIGTDKYIWSSSGGFNGLVYDKVDYVERYTFNGSIDDTKKTPTRVTLEPVNITINSGLNTNTYRTSATPWNKRLPNNVFNINNPTTSMNIQSSSIGPNFYDNTIYNSFNGVTITGPMNNNILGSCINSLIATSTSHNIIGGGLIGTTITGQIFNGNIRKNGSINAIIWNEGGIYNCNLNNYMYNYVLCANNSNGFANNTCINFNSNNVGEHNSFYNNTLQASNCVFEGVSNRSCTNNNISGNPLSNCKFPPTMSFCTVCAQAQNLDFSKYTTITNWYNAKVYHTFTPTFGTYVSWYSTYNTIQYVQITEQFTG